MHCPLSHHAVSLAVALLLVSCDGLQRDNPLDPAWMDAPAGSRAVDGDLPPLAIRLPIPKVLRGVVDRIVAVLDAPDILPVVKELEISPLGPASCTMGALQAGVGRTLSIRGYDLQGELLFQGIQTDITIAAGETTAVVVHLELTQPLPTADDGASDDAADSGAAVDAADTSAEDAPATTDTSGTAAGAGDGLAGGTDEAGTSAADSAATAALAADTEE